MSYDLLLGTDARRRVLARTHLDPLAEFHVRELVRLTGLAPRTVQLEVERLVGAGLLNERRSGNRRYLRANERHPLYSPVREIVVKTVGLGDVLRRALGTDGVDLALVFGSMASGETGAESDVDLLIVGDVGLRDVVGRLARAATTLAREINPVVWTQREFERRRSSRDPFLLRILERPNIVILGEERSVAHPDGS